MIHTLRHKILLIASSKRTSAMTEEERDKAKAAAVASVGAGVGSAGGATLGC